MKKTILQTFISKLNFVEKITKQPFVTNYEITFNNYLENQEQITGFIKIKYKFGEDETIPFEIHKKEISDILIFNAKFLNEGNIKETKDIFAISNEQPKILGQKVKVIVHIVDNKIVEAYSIGKNHKFENGIHDNLPRLNLKNKEISNILFQAYPTYSQKRR